MRLNKSTQRFLMRAGGARFILSTVALVGMILLCASGISNAQSQPKAQQSSPKAGEAYIKVIYPAKNEVWEKGKRYTIRWESKGVQGNVTILLVGEDVKRSTDVKAGGLGQAIQGREAKTFGIARNTYNGGSFSYVVSADIPDGVYKVQVMTIDGSIKGESEGTVAIRGQKPVSAKVMAGAQAPQGAAATSAKAAPSAGTAPSAGATAAAGKTATAAATSAKGATPSVAVAGKTPTAAAKIVRQDIAAVEVPQHKLKGFIFKSSTSNASHYEIGGHSTAKGKIIVYTPKDGDIWEADKEYNITWESTDVTGDVKIASGMRGEKTYQYTIADKTPNTGAYRFRVPRNWVLNPLARRVRVSSLDGTVWGDSPGTITVYTQFIDLVCKVMDPKINEERETYPYYVKHDKWLEFNVWWRNDGTQAPIEIWPVVVRVIKEPEELVCYQEEWSVSRIYPHVWYQLPEPRKFSISHLPDGGWSKEQVNLKKGAYRVEVELDPQNRLGENEQRRFDNKVVTRWIIQ